VGGMPSPQPKGLVGLDQWHTRVDPGSRVCERSESILSREADHHTSDRRSAVQVEVQTFGGPGM
jgi:hypothetical protein